MACNFTITFQGSAADFIAKAKAKVEENNGTLDGGTSSGSFDVPTSLGHITGNYSIDGQDITIDISHKPIVVGCGAIQNYINGHL